MNANLRDALKTLKQAQASRDAGDYAKAREFCDKSIASFSTPEALKLRETINVLDPQAKTTHPLQNVQFIRRSTSETNEVIADSKSAPDPTESSGEDAVLHAQKEVVKRVLSCKGSSYYDVLSVGKDATAVEIKISYRKLATQLNPAHNKAPGASEAFSCKWHGFRNILARFFIVFL
ncbi:hypothetical protein SCHPADRAFT_825427 [Schizopora paradoxa]|uniref:J domain-containing protein n=1 Tax=Schizopora paradoxa TaxID=27342 RepID=A0A0H2RSU2_9AGAM|nr:hypothetical protein SCHPADRAFT_825427 [Schizopora paradoxa]